MGEEEATGYAAFEFMMCVCVCVCVCVCLSIEMKNGYNISIYLNAMC
jgi:hypothetical protein